MRGGARVAPDRRPEHERDAGRARAEIRGGERDAARQPGDHGAEAARRGEPPDRALGWAQDRERGVVDGDRAPVAQAAADEREHDVLGRVQGGEGADAERGRVVGDEEDRPRVRPARHRSAAS